MEAKQATLVFLAAIITADCKNEMTIKIQLISTQQERNNVIYMFNEQVATPVTDKAKKNFLLP